MELNAELALVAAHIGMVGEPSAVCTLVRQIEAPSGAPRSLWQGRIYLARVSRFDGNATFDAVLDSIADQYNDRRAEWAQRRFAVVSVSGMDFAKDLRKRKVGMHTQVNIADGRGVATTAAGAVTIPKTELVKTLVQTVQRDLFRVLEEVEKIAGVKEALATIQARAPRAKPRYLAPDEEAPVQEDPILLAIQVGLWKMGQLTLRLPGGGDGEVAERYHPLAGR